MGKTVFRFTVLNVLGTLLYAIGIVCFTAPSKIAPGGASGVATLIQYGTGFPIGMMILVFNIPLLALAYARFPKEFVIKTMISTVLSSLITDAAAMILPEYTGEPLLAAMFGGALMGAGLALVHVTESNTGGMSLLGLILRQKMPHWPVGRMVTVLNMTVVLASGIVYRNIESVLYAAVCVYISGYFMDGIVGTLKANNMMIIISEKAAEVNTLILEHQRGVTILNGRGGYTGDKQDVLMSVVPSSLCDHIQQEVEQLDPSSFVIIADAARVNGKGFRSVI